MLMEQLPKERLVIVWQAMAMIEAALERTAEHVKQRRMFGGTFFDRICSTPFLTKAVALS